jgi:hypothetical protein
MKIEGVPEGWELVGFKPPVKGDFIIDIDGSPYQILHVDVTAKLPIIRKVEPACSWPLGVFADGWLSQSSFASAIYWSAEKPEWDPRSAWWMTAGEDPVAVKGYLANHPVFREGLPWDERIQQVGPTVESRLKGEVV